MILGESGYDRSKTAFTDDVHCDHCSKFARCLCTDSSDDEYGPVCLCLECIGKLLEMPIVERECTQPQPYREPGQLLTTRTMAAIIRDTYTASAFEPMYKSFFPK